jgi:hypothetical protein
MFILHHEGAWAHFSLGGYLHPKPPCFHQASKGFIQNPCQFDKNCLRPFKQENLTVCFALIR